MTTRSSSDIQREIEFLRAEQAEAIEGEHNEAEAIREREKAAEATRLKAAEAAAKRRTEKYYQSLREDEAQELDWWTHRCDKCYVPITTGKFANTGLCSTFLAGGPQSEDLCAQCQRGFQNPSWLAGKVHAEKARVGY